MPLQILKYASEGLDLEPLLPALVKLLAHSDMLIKKIAGDLVVRYGHSNTEVVLLAVNTLVQDAEDSNPMIRGKHR